MFVLTCVYQSSMCTFRYQQVTQNIIHKLVSSNKVANNELNHSVCFILIMKLITIVLCLNLRKKHNQTKHTNNTDEGRFSVFTQTSLQTK